MMMTLLAFFQETKEQPNFMYTFLPFLFFIGLIYFMVIRPNIKQQKEHQGLVDNIKKGDKVITNGGLWGEVDAVEVRHVRLKINDKTKVLVSRSAISSLQPKAGEESKSTTEKGS